MSNEIKQWLADQWLDNIAIGEANLSDVIARCLNDLSPKWVSVDDELPINSDGLTGYKTVRVVATDGVISGEMNFSAGLLPGPWFEWSEYGDFEPSLITHWQPLPPPTSESEL
tara:strand:+ start:160 stop:498 length:339 start_codon:yes stop_codon:yes gene_type:complete